MAELLPLVWAFLCVAVIVGLAYWFTRYVVGRGRVPGSGGDRTSRLRLLARLTVGRDQQVLLVQAGERCLLLGASPGGVTLLAEFTPEQAAAFLETGGPGAGAPSFSQALGTALRQWKKR